MKKKEQPDRSNKYQFLFGVAFGALVVSVILIVSFHQQNATKDELLKELKAAMQQQQPNQFQNQNQNRNQNGAPKQFFDGFDQNSAKQEEEQEASRQARLEKERQRAQKKIEQQEGGGGGGWMSNLVGNNQKQGGANLLPSELKEEYGDRVVTVPTNGKSSIPQIQGNDESTIFIAIAAYRDVECAETLLEMYRTAHAPDRLRVRIVQHISATEGGEKEVWFLFMMFVLFCFVLFCFVLFCFVLFCFVLFVCLFCLFVLVWFFVPLSILSKPIDLCSILGLGQLRRRWFSPYLLPR